MFYLITNTASWLFNPFHNPEYTKTIAGWIIALTKGTGGYPPTWEFFRNTLLSGGLFTALFAAAAKLTAESPADKTAGAREPNRKAKRNRRRPKRDAWRVTVQPRSPQIHHVTGHRHRHFMKIGVISDTHGFLDPRVEKIFAGVDHILHAGDIGNPMIELELKFIAPVTVVLGNTDAGLTFKRNGSGDAGGQKISHPPHRQPAGAVGNSRKPRIARERPDVVVFGHTHKKFAETVDGVLFFNPGYAGKPKFGAERSVAILHLDGERASGTSSFRFDLATGETRLIIRKAGIQYRNGFHSCLPAFFIE